MKRKNLITILIFSTLLTLSNFANAQKAQIADTTAKPTDEIGFFDEYVKGYYSQVFGVDISSILNVDLYKSIENWLGTPYKYAGKSLQGIDCSAFVNKIYENAYCYMLTGNSASLFKQAIKLPKDKLEEGDLVFFKINKKTVSHVGVYLGENKFAHASRSKGVIVSDLNHPYYKKYFVEGGRINFDSN